jgi:arylsulfatase A-like enzyme
LHRAGYRTALIGKYLNAYPGNHVPPGWDRWAAFAREGDGGAYYDYDLFVHDARGSRFEHHGTAAGDYSTTVLKDRALAFIRGTPAGHPFFLYVAPFAAHARIVPAPRDRHAYDGYETPLPPNFNEADVSDKPPYVRASRPVSAAFYEERYRKEFEALRSVDRMVGDILGELRSSGRLHDTLVVFMSDNGAAFGEHRWDFKLTPYEEVIRIPFVVRYPPLTASTTGARTHAIVANIDVAPTLADVAGIDFHGVGTVDGVSLAPILDGSRRRVRRSFLLEHLYESNHHPVPTYCGLRTPRWTYARYRDGFQELYDLDRDPYELQNLAHVPALAGVLRELRARTKRACDPPPPGYRWP